VTIRRRLTLGFLTILALFALNEGIQLWSARLRADTMEALSGALKRQVLMASVHQQIGNLQGLMSQMSQLEDPAPVGNEYTADIARAGTDIHELVGLSDDREHSAFSDLEQAYVKLSAALRAFFGNLGVDDAKNVAAQLEAEPVGKRVLEQILPKMQAQQDESVKLARQSFDDVTRRTDQVSLAIFVLSMLVSVGIAYLIGSYLTTRLGELQLGAGLIGAMNLEHRITVRSSDEIGTVAAAFNNMATNLSRAQEELTAANSQLTVRNAEVERERQVSQSLLLNILPEQVAAELASNGQFAPRYFEDVTVLFTDFVGFTLATEKLAADELVNVLHGYFTAFDKVVSRYGLEKMKTIGDAYFCAGGLPVRTPSHPVDATLAAFEMIHEVEQRTLPGGAKWKVRIGLNTGPVVAGVVGIRKFAFDVWGDTVNLGSRMESGGAPNRINVSEPVYRRVKDFFTFESRGKILTKEKKELETYFITGIQPALLTDVGVDGSAVPIAFAQRYRTYFGKDLQAFPAFLSNNEADAQSA
jgi:class 3 adenylate cyclase/HAMP domain-containing protein